MANKTINIELPKNVKSNNYLYQNRSYVIDSLKVLNIRNIEVTHDGVCFKNNEIIKESVQAYPDKVKIFELESRLKFLKHPFLSLQDNEQYLLIHHPWVNYYHWITEVIPRIWLIKKYSCDLTLILPNYFRNIVFIQETLKPFIFKKIYYFPDGYNLKVPNAIIPQIKPFCYCYDPKGLMEIKNFYLNYIRNNQFIENKLGDKIYIMRGNSNRRKIVNEGLLINSVRKYGFTAVEAMRFSFFEQVIFSNNAQFLISNGSGLTNMHFMNEGSTVLELRKKITNINDFHDRVLWHMASALKLNYYCIECDPIDKECDMYIADLRVNLHRLEKIIIRMHTTY